MYLSSSDTTTRLDNSSTPMTQARIDAQNQRVARKGAHFINGNVDMGAVIGALTPPSPTSSCDNLKNSLSLMGRVFRFPAPSPYSNQAALLAYPSGGVLPAFPTTNPGGGAAPSPGLVPVASSPGAPTTTAPGNGWPSGGCFGLGAFRAGNPRRFRLGFGDLADEVYHGGMPIILEDGTIINDPAHTTPTQAQCWPYHCFADQGNNLAARYWCAFYGMLQASDPCTTPACAPYKAKSGLCPASVVPTAQQAQPSPAVPPQKPAAGLYPHATVLAAPLVPTFPCSSSMTKPAAPASPAAGSGNCWLQAGLGAAALFAMLYAFEHRGR